MPPGPQWNLGSDSTTPELTVSYLADRVGLRIAGQADLSNIDDLRTAIAALPPEAAEVHLELGRLEFIDVRAVRELLAVARQPGHTSLVMHDPPWILQRLVGLLWPGSSIQLVMSHSDEPVPPTLPWRPASPRVRGARPRVRPGRHRRRSARGDLAGEKAMQGLS